MKRYLGTLFRGKWLFSGVLVLMLGATAAGTYMNTAQPEYESTARVWIDRPVLDSILDQGQNNGFVGPAAQQSGKLYQLLQTDTFILSIVRRTSLAGQLDGRSDQLQALTAAVRERLQVTVVGGNTLAISYRAGEPGLCQQMVQSVIEQFRSWSVEQQGEQRSAELQYYETQLQVYEQQMNDARDRLETYQRQHPDPEPNSQEASELAGLQREVESARSLYALEKIKVDQANLLQSLSDKNKQSEFQVLDKPTVPDRPVTSLKKVLKFVVLGVGASFGLVLAALVAATWLDPTIRSAEDLRRLGAPAVLQVIPPLPAASEEVEEEPEDDDVAIAPRWSSGPVPSSAVD